MDYAERESVSAYEHFLFVTGQLAEPLLKRMLPELATTFEFEYSVAVMPITIAGLMNVPWVADRLQVPAGATRILLPGRCHGDPGELCRRFGIPAERGPNDLHDLPDFFRRRSRPCLPQDEYSLKIVSVIKDAANLESSVVLDLADRLVAEGADAIGLWHEDREPFADLGKLIKSLKSQGHRVWVRSLEKTSYQAAAAAGVDFLEPFRPDWAALPEATCGVVEPRLPGTWQGVEEVIAAVSDSRRLVLLKQPLIPVGLGLAQSILRCVEARELWPEVPLVMDLCPLLYHCPADAGPMLLILLGLADEIGVCWITTTQEVNTARTSVRECHAIRRMTHCAKRFRVSLRSVDWSFAMLRDHHLGDGDEQYLEELRSRLRDPSPRLFVAGDQLRAWAFGQDLQADDAYELFDQIVAAAESRGKRLDAETSFYLGYELCKAAIARQLGKNYCQDEALHWGLHTVPEPSPRERHLRRLSRRRTLRNGSRVNN
ncbi:MAG: DUF6513 domain-containing protein [Thermogutta sp.]